MAEFVMKDIVRRADLQNNFMIESAATSREELGNDIMELKPSFVNRGFLLHAGLLARLLHWIMKNTIILSQWMMKIFTI